MVRPPGCEPDPEARVSAFYQTRGLQEEKLDEKTVAGKLRKLRHNKDITLKALASATGFTEGYLSRIENSKTIPPIPTLDRIAHGLGMNISYLLQEEEEIHPRDPNPNLQVFKKKDISERKRDQDNQKGYRFEALALEMSERNMHPYLIKAEFDFGDLQQHDGEELIYILEGSFEFLHGSNKYVLEKGDCVYYYAHIPHCGRSIGKKRAKVLTVIYDYRKHNPRVVAE
jgi:transcriptional regulator with XRE-family HTH domain